jgi:MFS family permease
METARQSMAEVKGEKFRKCAAFILPCFLVCFGFPGQSPSLGVFTDSILYTTGLSRNTFSAVYTAATITGCLLTATSGQLIDGLGLRKSTLLAIGLWSVILLSLGNCQLAYRSFLHCAIPSGTYFAVVLYAHFSLMRCIGQNMFPMLGRTQIVRIFFKNRGMAIALCGTAVAISSNAAPTFMHFMLKNSNWQNSYNLLSALSFAVLIVYFIFSREMIGGKSAAYCNLGAAKNLPMEIGQAEWSSAAEKVNEAGKFSKWQLLRMPIFWCIVPELCIDSFIGSGTAVHLVDIFREHGLSGECAAKSYFYMCFISIGAGLVFGRLVDKNRTKLCLLSMLSMQFIGLIGLENLGNFFGFWAYIAAIGGAYAGRGILLSAVLIKVFAGNPIGVILGLAYALCSISGAISVFLTSLCHEIFGSYSPLLNFLELVILVAALFVMKNFREAVECSN